MIRRYKTLILFLVLTTMSLRAAAAMDMWHCAHHHESGAAASAALHAQHHGMHGEVPADHGSGLSGAGASDAADPVDGSTSSYQLGEHCISGAVAPVEQVLFSFAPVAASRIPFFGHALAGVVPAQLERPPLVRPL